ncbi:hypothetical protein [Bradyrhizobium ottawaense]
MSTYAIEIADKVLELLKATTPDEPTPFFKSYWRTPMRQVAASDLPLLGVYILRETRGPDGDENAGEIRFTHRLHLGIAGAISNADPGEQLRILEERMADIDERLLTNPEFVRMIEGRDRDGSAVAIRASRRDACRGNPDRDGRHLPHLLGAGGPGRLQDHARRDPVSDRRCRSRRGAADLAGIRHPAKRERNARWSANSGSRPWAI